MYLSSLTLFSIKILSSIIFVPNFDLSIVTFNVLFLATSNINDEVKKSNCKGEMMNFVSPEKNQENKPLFCINIAKRSL